MVVNTKSKRIQASLWFLFFLASIYVLFVTKYSLLFYDCSFTEVIDYSNAYSENLYNQIKNTKISSKSTDLYFLKNLAFSKNYDFFVLQCISESLEYSKELNLLVCEEICISYPYIMYNGLQQNYICFNI